MNLYPGCGSCRKLGVPVPRCHTFHLRELVQSLCPYPAADPRHLNPTNHSLQKVGGNLKTEENVVR